VFEVGEKVVHPVHGAGTVSRIEERIEDGRPVLYYIIPDALVSCALMIPVSTAEDIGLRHAMPQTCATEVYQAIRDAGVNGDTGAAEATPSGAEETIKVARALGRLLHKRATSSISQAERRDMDRLKRLLVGELSLVTGYAESRISALIENCVVAVPAESAAARAKRKK